jgi:hypothetical protein
VSPSTQDQSVVLCTLLSSLPFRAQYNGVEKSLATAIAPPLLIDRSSARLVQDRTDDPLAQTIATADSRQDFSTPAHSTSLGAGSWASGRNDRVCPSPDVTHKGYPQRRRSVGVWRGGWQPQSRRLWGWLFRVAQKTIAKLRLTLPPGERGLLTHLLLTPAGRSCAGRGTRGRASGRPGRRI